MFRRDMTERERRLSASEEVLKASRPYVGNTKASD